MGAEEEATGTTGKTSRVLEAEDAGKMVQMAEAEATGTGTAGMKKVMETEVAGTNGKIQAQMMEAAAEVIGIEAAGTKGAEMMMEAGVTGTARIGNKDPAGTVRMDSRQGRSGSMRHGPARKMKAMEAAAADGTGTAAGEVPALLAEKRTIPQTDALSQSSPAAVLPQVPMPGPRVGFGRPGPISMAGRT